MRSHVPRANSDSAATWRLRPARCSGLSEGSNRVSIVVRRRLQSWFATVQRRPCPPDKPVADAAAEPSELTEHVPQAPMAATCRKSSPAAVWPYPALCRRRRSAWRWPAGNKPSGRRASRRTSTPSAMSPSRSDRCHTGGPGRTRSGQMPSLQ